jgi:uncharacterized protein (UPF0333 family)
MKYKKKKAQVSFEFTLSIVMGMIIVVALLAMFANKMHEVMNESQDDQVSTILEMLSDEIDFAKGSSPGYSRIFALPQTVDGDPYELNFTNATIYATTIAISFHGKDFTTGFSYPVNVSLCLESLNETTQYFEVKRTGSDVILNNCPDCEIDYEECFYYHYEVGSCTSLGDLETQCEERYCLC